MQLAKVDSSENRVVCVSWVDRTPDALLLGETSRQSSARQTPRRAFLFFACLLFQPGEL